MLEPDTAMNDATDYSHAFPAKPQPLSLEQAAWIMPLMQSVVTEGMIDLPCMRRYRQNRLREQIVKQGFDAIILVEPLSIRYATGARNCTLFQMHVQTGCPFGPAVGPVVHFDIAPGRETGSQLETIDEIRPDILPLSYMFAGPQQPPRPTHPARGCRSSCFCARFPPIRGWSRGRRAARRPSRPISRRG